MTSLLATIMMYVNFVMLILLTVISGVGFGYFNTEFSFFNCTINHRLMFGFGIGCGLLLIIFNFVLYVVPFNFFNYIITIPGFIVICALYITYSVDKERDVCLKDGTEEWYNNEAGLIDIQLKYKCCGWENATDHGLVVCPFDYESSCKEIYNKFISPRMDIIFDSAITILVVNLVSWIVIYGCLFAEDEDNVCDLCEDCC